MVLSRGNIIFAGATLLGLGRAKEKEHAREDVVPRGCEREFHFFLIILKFRKACVLNRPFLWRKFSNSIIEAVF